MTANNYSSLLKYISMMKRDTNRYFQMKLKKFNLGGGQQFFLLRIAENPGISMYDLARTGAFDKATVTKAVNKLLAEGYITQETDAKDRRLKRLKTTDKAKEVIDYVYEIRDKWISQMMDNFSEEEAMTIYKGLEKMAEHTGAAICKMNEEEKKGEQ